MSKNDEEINVNQQEIDETRDVFQNYEKCIELTVSSGVNKEEDESLLYFPSDNIEISKKEVSREKGEKVEPKIGKKEKLPIFATRSVEYFKSPTVRILHKYKKYKKIDSKGIKIHTEKYEIDKKKHKDEDKKDSNKEKEEEKEEEKKKEKKKEKTIVKKKKEHVIPSIRKTKSKIKKNITSQLFHIYDRFFEEEEYSWNGGSEVNICKRVPTKKLRDLNTTTFLVSVQKFETLLQEKYGDLEPLFLEMALYDVEENKKLSEDFYFDFNDEEMINLIPKGAKYIKEAWDNKVLFEFNGTRSPNIVMVIILSKVLEGKEDSCFERYMSPLKFKEQDLKKLKKSVPLFCERLGFLRQSLCYTLLPVFDDDEELILGGESQQQVFYKCNGNANIINFLSDDGKESKSIKTGTGSKKLKTVPAKIELDVLELQDYNPIHKENGVISVNNKIDVRKAVSFPSEEQLKFKNKYMNYLYIYPKQFKSSSSSKTIAIRIQIKDNDLSLNDQSPLKCIFGRSSQDILITTAYTKCSYGNKKPEFNDEFKIKLPGVLTPKHHILFSFYNVVSKLKSSKSTLNLIGHCDVPLVNDNGKIVSGEKTLGYTSEFLNGGTHYTRSGMKKKETHKAFKVQFKAMTTVYPEERNLAAFFADPEKNIKRIIKAFDKDKMGFIQKIPQIFNQLFFVICNTFENKVLTEAFTILLEVVYLISDYMNETQRCKLLWEYIETVFVNPVTKNSYPFFQIAHLWLSLIKDGQNKRKISDLGGQKPFYRSLQYSWFFFEIIYKSIVLYLNENKVKGRLNDNQFTNILKKLVDGLSVEVAFRIKELQVAKDLNCKLALFLRDLFNVMDRGQVLVLIDHYLQHLNTLKKSKEVIQEIRMIFCRVISDYEHYVPMALPKSFKITAINVEKRLCDMKFLCGIISRQCIKDCCDRERTVRERCFELIKDLLTKHEYDNRYNDKDRKRKIAGMYFPFVLFFLEKYEDYYSAIETKFLNFKTIYKELKFAHSRKKAHLEEHKAQQEHIKNDDQAQNVKEIINKIEKELKEHKTKLDEAKYNYEEEKVKVKHEKQYAMLCIINVLYHMDRTALMDWCKVEVKKKVGILLKMFKDTVKLFEYRGKKKIEEQEGKYGINMSSNKALTESKKQIEQLYSFGSFTGGLRGRAARTAKLRKRRSEKMSRLSLGRSLRGSIKRKNSLNRRKLDGEGVKRKSKWEGSLSSSITFCLLDILLDMIKVFEYKDEFMRPIFDIILRFFETNQSERVLLSFFPFLKCFLELYRTRLFSDETPYSEYFCLELMKKCYSKFQKVRTRAAACLYLLIKYNYLEMGNFTRTKIQTTTKLSRIVQGLTESDVKLLNSCFLVIAEYAKEDQEVKLSKQLQRNQKKKSANFANQVASLVERLQTTLLDTRKINEYLNDISAHEKLVELFLRLAHGSKDAPELSVTWYNNLSDFNKEQKRYIEAAQCKIFIASVVFQYFLLKEDKIFNNLDFNLLIKCSPLLKDEQFTELKDLFRESSPNFVSNYFTTQGFIDLINETIGLFDRAKYYEYRMNLFKLLQQYYEQNNDYRNLHKIYTKLAESCKTLSDIRYQSRFFGMFYLLTFYGKKWEEKNKKSFIYKFPKLSKIADVMNQLRKTYAKFGEKNICIESSSFISKVTDEHINNEVKAYVVIQPIHPFKEGLKDDADYFEKNTNVNRFIFETPFTKIKPAEGKRKKQHARSLDEQYLRKTIVTVRKVFPSLTISSEVIETKEIELTPIENACRIIQTSLKRLAEFKKDEKKERIDVNTLQMVLTGTVIPQVHEGIPTIINTFIVPLYLNDDRFKKFAEELKKKLKEFLELSFFGIKLNEKYINYQNQNKIVMQFDLHEQFLKGYFKLFKIISAKVGGCEVIGKKFLRYLDSNVKDINTIDAMETEFDKCLTKFNRKRSNSVKITPKSNKK